MSCVNVFVGQCGNQLGASLLQRLASEAEQSGSDEYQQQVSSSYFRQPQAQAMMAHPSRPFARVVMVDMEPKVIESVVAKCEASGKYTVNPHQCVSRGEGSANNWAFGYLQQGPSRAEEISESLRRESEIAGTVSSYHVVHGAAGGTGSGVGCLVSDIVREEYPRSVLLHSVVWPFAHGEVITQWYNCTLALSCLVDNADGILLLPNDDAAAQVLSRSKTSSPQKAEVGTADTSNPHQRTGAASSSAVSYDSINALFGESLASMLLPQSVCTIPQPFKVEKRSKLLVKGGGDDDQRQAQVHVLHPSTSLFNLVESMTDPCRKIFHVQSCPTSGEGSLSQALRHVSWANTCRESLRVAERMGAYRFAIVARGPDVMTDGVGEFCASLAATPQLAGNLDAWHASTVPFGSFSSHVSTFYTSSRTGELLAHALRQVESMLAVQAFTHHFTRFGVSTDDIKDAVIRGWSTVSEFC